MRLVEDLQKCKLLYDDGIIDIVEYIKIKESLINNISDDNLDLDDLRGLKTLLDGGVINDEDYNTARGNILGKVIKTKEKEPAIRTGIRKITNIRGNKKVTITVALLVLIIVVLIQTAGARVLPGDVHIGDSYKNVLKAAASADQDAEENDGSIIFKTDYCGYDCEATYYFDVSFRPEKVYLRFWKPGIIVDELH